jgi:hypothetical protein
MWYIVLLCILLFIFIFAGGALLGSVGIIVGGILAFMVTAGLALVLVYLGID